MDVRLGAGELAGESLAAEAGEHREVDRNRETKLLRFSACGTRFTDDSGVVSVGEWATGAPTLRTADVLSSPSRGGGRILLIPWNGGGGLSSTAGEDGV